VKKPIYMRLVSSGIIQEAHYPYLVHVVDNTVDNFTLERFEHDRTITRDKLGLTAPTENHAFSDVEDGDDSDDVAELAGAGSFYIGVELGLEELEHPRAEVGWVEKDGVGQLFLGGLVKERKEVPRVARLTMKNMAEADQLENR
jgi:hypothetical protein